MRVHARADGGAAERDLAETLAAVAHALDALAHLRGVAGELLAEGDGHGVHQVRPARLDDVVELLGLLLQRRGQRLEGGKQVVLDLAERREVDGRGEDVVRALAHVDVVVRVHVVAGERRDHLVRVHVRARARAGLEDVDRKLVVVLALGDRVAGGGDPLGLLGVEQAEVGVRTRGGGLDPAEPARDGNGIGSPETGKFATAFRVSPPQSSREISVLTGPKSSRPEVEPAVPADACEPCCDGAEPGEGLPNERRQRSKTVKSLARKAFLIVPALVLAAVLTIHPTDEVDTIYESVSPVVDRLDHRLRRIALRLSRCSPL